PLLDVHSYESFVGCARAFALYIFVPYFFLLYLASPHQVSLETEKEVVYFSNNDMLLSYLSIVYLYGLCAQPDIRSSFLLVYFLLFLFLFIQRKNHLHVSSNYSTLNHLLFVKLMSILAFF